MQQFHVNAFSLCNIQHVMIFYNITYNCDSISLISSLVITIIIIIISNNKLQQYSQNIFHSLTKTGILVLKCFNRLIMPLMLNLTIRCVMLKHEEMTAHCDR